MIEKATELGVGAIQPLVTERSEHGLERAAPKRAERWRRIVMEASQQCRRMRVPEVKELVPLGEVLAGVEGARIWLDERPGGRPLLEVRERERPTAVTLLLGPEGGWADREATSIGEAGWAATSLGSLVLRAETAAMAALTLVQARGSAYRESRA